VILGSEAITLTRPTVGTWGSDGRQVPGASASTTIYGSVQPATGKDLEILPEGLRTKDAKRVYTYTALTPANQHTETTGDILVIDTFSYEVQQVKRERSIIAHYRAICTRLQE